MSDHTLAIIFRNPRPKRSPIDNEFYLLRRDGSSSLIHYSDKVELNRAEAPAVVKRFSVPDGDPAVPVQGRAPEALMLSQLQNALPSVETAGTAHPRAVLEWLSERSKQ
jgi:hypothetical protein